PRVDRLPARCRADRLRLVDRDGRRPARRRVRGHLSVAALLARSPGRMRSSPALPASPLPAGSRPPAAARRPRLSSRRLWDALSHAYIWAVLVVFILPFLALVGFSF